MIAKKCDKCFTYYGIRLPGKPDHINVCSTSGEVLYKYDLCPSCMEKLESFLRGKKDE